MIFTTKNNELTIFGQTLDDVRNKLITFDDIIMQGGSLNRNTKQLIPENELTQIISQNDASIIVNNLNSIIDKTNESYTSFDEYFSVLKEKGQRYVADYVKENQNQVYITDDVIEASKKARAAQIAQNETIKNSTLSIKANQAVLKGLAMAGNIIVFTLVSKGIELAANAINDYTNRVEKCKEHVTEMISAFDSAISTANSHKDAINKIGNRYEELSKGVDNLGENVSLTSDEYAEYNEIVNQIAEMFPRMVKGYTSEGNAILTLKGNVEALTEAYESEAQAAYNALIASGKDSNNNDIITDWKYSLSEDKGKGTNITNAIKELEAFMSSDIDAEMYTSLREKASAGIYDGMTDAEKIIAGSEFLPFKIKFDLDEDGIISDEELAKAKEAAKVLLQTYRSEIESDFTNVKTLANAYLMTNMDFKKLDESSQSAASLLLNSIPATSDIAQVLMTGTKEEIGEYVNFLVQAFSSDNPKVNNALINLLTLDTETMSPNEIQSFVDSYISIIADYLQRDENELKIQFGFEDINETVKKYENAINKFGESDIDSLEKLFSDNSINSLEEIAYWEKVTGNAKSATDAINMYNTAKKSIAKTSSLHSVSSTINQLDTKLKPALTSLSTVWNNIFSVDNNGNELLTLDKADISALNSIQDVLRELDLSTDIFGYDNLVQVLTDTSSTTEQVKSAFNLLATSMINSSDSVAVTKDNFNLLKQSLSGFGATNADEVLTGILNAQNELASLGYTVANITDAEAAAIINEGTASAQTAEYLRYYMIQKQLSTQPLNTYADISALEGLCNSLGVTVEMLQWVASLKSALGAVESGAPIEAFQRQIDTAKEKIAELTASGNGSFQFDFGDSLAKSTENISKSAAPQLDVLSDLTSELNTLKSGYDAVKDAAETYNEYGRISVDQAEQLIGTDLRLLAAMDSEENAYYSLANAKLEEMKIQMARNALNTLNSLQTEADAVEYLAMANVNLRNQTLSANEALLQQAVMQKQNMGGAMADAAGTIWQGYQNAVSMLGKVDLSFDVSAAKQASENQAKQAESAKETDLADEFNEQKKALDHMLAMDEMNKSEYYAKLMDLANKMFAGNDKYKENLWDVQEQYHDYLESIKKTYNWMENLLESLSRKTNAFIDKAEKFISWQKKNAMINRAVKAADNEIAKNQSAYGTYMKKANSVGLGNNYIRKIQNGTLNIEETSDEELSEKIEKYTDWYDKAQDVLETIHDLYDRERDLIRQKLDNVLDYYGDLDSYLSSVTSKMESLISLNDSMGKRSSLTELVKQFAETGGQLSSAVTRTPGITRTEMDFGESEAVNAAKKEDKQKEIDSIQAQIDNLDVTQSGTYTKLLKDIAKTEAQIQKYQDKGWDTKKAKQYEKLKAKLEDYYELQAELDANATSDTIAGYSKIYTAYQKLQNKIDSGKTLTKSQQKKYDSYLQQMAGLQNKKDSVLSELETRLGLANGTIASDTEEETVRQKIAAVQSDLENTATYRNLTLSIETAESDLAALEEKGYDNLTGKQKKTYDKLTKQLEAYYEKKQAFDENATAANIAEYDKIYSSWKELQDKLDAGKNLTTDQWKDYNNYTKQLEGFAVSKEETMADLQSQLDKITNPGDKLEVIEREYEEAAEGIYDSYQHQIDGVKNAVTETTQYRNLLANAQKLEQKKDTKGLTSDEQAKLDKYNAELEALRQGGTAGNISDYIKTWEKWYTLEQKLQKNGKLSESDAGKYDTYQAQLKAWNEEKQSQINDLVSQMEDDLEALQKTYTENISEAESEINDYYANLYDLAKQIAEYNLNTLETQLSFLEAYINYYKELVSLYDSFSGDKLTKLLTDLDIDLIESQDSLYQQYLAKLQEKYNTTLSKIREYNELIEAIDTNDFAGSMELFQKAIAEYQADGQAEMAAKLQSVLDLLDERAAASDNWDAFADEWLTEWEEALAAAKTELISTAASIQEVNDALREMNFSNITNAVKELSDAQEILSSITGLIHDDWLYDEDGNLTKYGITKVGLLAEQIESAKQEVSKYAELIESVNSMKDTYASESAYKEALQEAKMNYLSSLSTLQGYQDSVVSILTKADEEVINSLQNVINKRKEALQKKKELYDYNKTIQSSQKEIDSIQAQIDALESLSGAADAAAKAKLAQLKADLDDKKQALQDTKDEHTYNLQIDALDEFMNTLSSAMTEAAESVNKSFETYVQALHEAAKIHEQTKNELPEQTSSLLSALIGLPASSETSPSDSVLSAITGLGTPQFLIPTLPSIPNLITERSTQPVVNVHYDNLLNIENNGSIDEDFVNGKMPEIIRRSFEYTAKELYSQSLRLR